MNTDAIVYVIDSIDDEYYEESKTQFHKMLNNPALKNATILIFANKQDLPGAKTVNKLIEDYGFDKIKSHIWHIQSCSALKGEGLVTGIKWLSEQLVFRGKNNFPNNPYIFNENEEQNNSTKNESKDISINVKDSAVSEANLKSESEVIGEINKNDEKKTVENNNDNQNNNSIS